jgi:hypothetical protein
MDESKRLALVLGFLNSEWDSLTAILDDDQLSYLESELEGLEAKLMDASMDEEETAEAARNFYPVFSNIKSLEFLSDLDDMGTRGGSTTELQEDIHNTLMSSIKKIKDRYPKKDESAISD